ncbi:hypothetical protein O9A_01412 [Bartonella koehlerae C-29]|uniref:Uncharacterized protein n=1 Tax=Bartonella koehlerae C-29 TaxID=1134510 RepID=A0A067WDQ5_9HYPH|nr:hypothetical protein O9A_01412 [Bartonella koehlerae C-29]
MIKAIITIFLFCVLDLSLLITKKPIVQKSLKKIENYSMNGKNVKKQSHAICTVITSIEKLSELINNRS